MTTGIKDQIDSIYAMLKNLPADETELYPAVPYEYIKQFEERFNVELPSDYKYLLSLSNGFWYSGYEVLGISFDSKDTRCDLTNTYNFEHYESGNPMYPYMVPFYSDGFGNFACFDTSKIDKNGSCPIIFWEHDVEYNETCEPEIINNSFLEFVLEIFIDEERDCTE